MIKKILKEINRLKKELDGYSASEALDYIESYINTLPEKHNEDFEEAAKHYLYGAILYDDVYVGNPTEEDCIRCFKAGTEWQRKKDQETIELAEDHAMLAGMMKEREEIMKDAVELTITNTSFIPLPKLDIKAGDKVKIIILKTE